MKQFFTLCSALLLVNVAQAQTIEIKHQTQTLKPNIELPASTITKFFPFQKKNSKSANKNMAKTTGTAIRLKAMAERSYDGSSFVRDGDSTQIYWHKESGSSLNELENVLEDYSNPFRQPHTIDNSENKFDSVKYWSTSLPGSMYNNLSFKVINTFDTQDNLLTTLASIWNGTSWDNLFKSTYTYDAKNNVLTYTEEEWDINTFIPSFKQENSYDAQSRTISTTYYSNNGTALVPVQLINVDYNTDGTVNLMKYSSWDGSAFTLNNQYEFGYNANQQRIYELEFINAGSNLDTGGILKFFYNAAGNLDSFLEGSFQGNNKWLSTQKNAYNYNSSNQLTKFENFQIEFINFQLTPNFKVEYAYTGNHISSFINSTWDANTSVYIYDEKTLLNYNSDNKLAYHETQTFHNNNWVFVAGDERVDYYYETYLGIKSIPTKIAFDVYPNPAHHVFNISASQNIESVRLIDMQGKELMTENPTGQKNISLNLEHIATGQYLIQIKTKDGFGTKQVVVAK